MTASDWTESGEKAACCTGIRGSAPLLEGLRREHPGPNREMTARAHTAAPRHAGKDHAAVLPLVRSTYRRRDAALDAALRDYFGRADNARPVNDGCQDRALQVEGRSREQS